MNTLVECRRIWERGVFSQNLKIVEHLAVKEEKQRRGSKVERILDTAKYEWKKSGNMKELLGRITTCWLSLEESEDGTKI